MIGRKIRAFWWAYALCVTLAVNAVIFGPGIEARNAPVRIDNTVTEITREGRELCWTWTSVKVIDRASDDVDVYLHHNRVRFSTSIYRRVDGMPWGLPAVLPPGPSAQAWCTTLPPFVRPGDPVRVEWRAWYPSSTGLWRVPLPLPDVLDPLEI